MARDDSAAPDRPSFTNAFGFGALSFGVSGVLALGSSILTARLYGITVIGEFALAYAPTGAVWFLSSVREQPALIRMLAPLAPEPPGPPACSSRCESVSCPDAIASCIAAGGIPALTEQSTIPGCSASRRQPGQLPAVPPTRPGTSTASSARSGPAATCSGSGPPRCRISRSPAWGARSAHVWG